MIRKIIFLFLILLIKNNCLSQQLPHFSLYMFNDVFINPAINGTKEFDLISISSRSQWVNFEGSPKTQLLNYNKKQGRNIGIGLTVFNDITGPISQTGTQFSYSYNMDFILDHKLSFGLSASIFQFVFDGSKAVLYDNIYDPAAMGGIEKSLVNDASFGIYFYNDKYHFGFSLPQLIQSKINIEKDNSLIRHYFFSTGYDYKINSQFNLKPSILFKSTDITPAQLDINLKGFYNNSLWAGLSYRHTDAIVYMLGFNYENYSIGYSFDHTLSEINLYSSGLSWTLLSYSINNKDNNEKTIFMQEDNDDLDFLQKVDTIHINDTVYINECDTVVLNNYINDTVYINECDTVVLNNYINDTVYINECDTVVLNNYIYDTLYINKYDTVLVNNYLYDTIYLNKYIKDTIYISKKINSLDTVLISEKNVVNEQIAFPNIEFETNKYEIRSTSLKVLMKLYNLLNTNPFLKKLKFKHILTMLVMLLLISNYQEIGLKVLRIF